MLYTPRTYTLIGREVECLIWVEGRPIKNPRIISKAHIDRFGG